jgi:hypothetical protein
VIDPTQEAALRALAKNARTAAEALHEQTNAIGMFPFKRGDYATQLLMIALVDHGFRDFVTMEVPDPYINIPNETAPYIHRWAEWDGFVIDLTADQFTEDFSGIVCGYSSWHQQLPARVNLTLTADHERRWFQHNGMQHHLDLFRSLWPIEYPR